MIGIIGGSGVYEITQKADSVEKKLVKQTMGKLKFLFWIYSIKQ